LSRRRGDPADRSWPAALTLALLAWIPVCALVWVFLTPAYNLFLAGAAERLVRVSERPSTTRLEPVDRNYLVITRAADRVRGLPYSVRTTDLHFPVILMAALFLSVPGVPTRRRLENLALAALIMASFHVLLLVAWVQFVYATQLGAWSHQAYGAFGRNFWGMAKHLLDLPFKLGLPLMLWVGFYFGELRADRRENPS
jgi:hypothetical protein